MKNEEGFTLVEVLASLVIISIVLMSFMALFGNTNRLAVTNSEKLVVINLADAYLERVKVTPNKFITFEDLKNNCSNVEKGWKEKESFIYPINMKDYEVKVKATQDSNECKLALINVVVEVTAVNSRISSKVEGYVTDVNVLKKVTK